MDYEYQAHLQKQKQIQPQPPQSLPERKKTIQTKKPTSIHDAAQAGDLRAVQTRLQDNALLINLRNPIVSSCILYQLSMTTGESHYLRTCVYLWFATLQYLARLNPISGAIEVYILKSCLEKKMCCSS